MTQRPLDLTEGALRRFQSCADLTTRANSGEVLTGHVVAVSAPARPGFTLVVGS